MIPTSATLSDQPNTDVSESKVVDSAACGRPGDRLLRRTSVLGRRSEDETKPPRKDVPDPGALRLLAARMHGRW